MSRDLREAPRPSRHLEASTRLGLTLRSVMLRPRDGYASAKRAGERRARAGDRLPEGASPYVLTATGGAALMCLWLKLGALVGLREANRTEFDGGVVAAAILLGALLGLCGQALWGSIGPWLVARLGGTARGRDLRVAWGAAALPLVGMLVLLPLDLAIVGPGVFGSDPLSDSIATAWAAISIAFGVALTAWSAWLLVRGVEVASRLRLRWALPAAVIGALCVVAAIGGLIAVGALAISDLSA